MLTSAMLSVVVLIIMSHFQAGSSLETIFLKKCLN
jgi:hypothetical protein